jgi:hypothetical protein
LPKELSLTIVSKDLIGSQATITGAVEGKGLRLVGNALTLYVYSVIFIHVQRRGKYYRTRIIYRKFIIKSFRVLFSVVK